MTQVAAMATRFDFVMPACSHCDREGALVCEGCKDIFCMQCLREQLNGRQQCGCQRARAAQAASQLRVPARSRACDSRSGAPSRSPRYRDPTPPWSRARSSAATISRASISRCAASPAGGRPHRRSLAQSRPSCRRLRARHPGPHPPILSACLSPRARPATAADQGCFRPDLLRSAYDGADRFCI